tara:strand:+ start:221 stop:568 length:348 start_codon:yes stop_codon:yes gene_type:complete
MKATKEKITDEHRYKFVESLVLAITAPTDKLSTQFTTEVKKLSRGIPRKEIEHAKIAVDVAVEMLKGFPEPEIPFGFWQLAIKAVADSLKSAKERENGGGKEIVFAVDDDEEEVK